MKTTKSKKAMKSNLGSYTYNNGKRNIGGTAAPLHFFKEHGGVDNVLSSLVEEAMCYAFSQLDVDDEDY